MVAARVKYILCRDCAFTKSDSVPTMSAEHYIPKGSIDARGTVLLCTKGSVCNIYTAAAQRLKSGSFNVTTPRHDPPGYAL